MPALMRSALRTIYTRWLERPIRRLGVARKFGYSYGLAIGIAVVGTNEYIAHLLDMVDLYQQEYPEPTSAIQTKIDDIDLPFLTQDMPRLFASMKMGTERIREIVLSLRTFSRLDEAEMKTVDIHAGIDSTLLILSNRLKHGTNLIEQYGELPLVECYPAQLNQVFMNILANAIDALDSLESWKVGRLEGSSCPVNLQPHQLTNPSTSHPVDLQTPTIWIRTVVTGTNQVTISIADNGPGIPAEIRNKLFDPFFTTKEAGKGTGLGLSISYQIIEKHEGRIDVHSDPGQGTEFAIALPIVARTTA